MECFLKCKKCGHEFKRLIIDGGRLPRCPKDQGATKYMGILPDPEQLDKMFDNAVLIDQIEDGKISL
jgi:hypothetical protein